jgi:hypothetical protein
LSSVPKPTILDYIGGDWLPFHCSICGRQDHRDIWFGWWGDPVPCWYCAESAPQDVRQRLQRVKAARRDLGFDNFSRFDLEDALWPKRGPFSSTYYLMPPVFGRPFTSSILQEDYIGERYYLHGLSGHPPDQIRASHEIARASVEYSVYSARPQVIEAYPQWKRFISQRWPFITQIGSASESPVRSEVLVYIGGAIVPKAHPEDHYMWSWQPEAPWRGYREGPHQTGSFPKKERDLLFTVGRELLDIHFRGRKKGSGRFDTPMDFEQAVFVTVCALRKRERPITQETIGASLIAKRGRNNSPGWRAGDSPADPGRQFREWCSRFEFNPEEMISLAIDTCASGE